MELSCTADTCGRPPLLTACDGLCALCVLGEVDKLFKVLTRAASEHLGNLSSNPRNVSSMHTSMASMGGGVNAEKERVYQFVSVALRFAMTHNSKHRNLDVDSVEQVSQHTLYQALNRAQPPSTHGRPCFIGGCQSCVCCV